MNLIQKLIAESITEKSSSAPEDEIVLYARIGNFDGLSKAEKFEAHEQWEIKSDNKKGRFRVRLTEKGNRPEISNNILIDSKVTPEQDYVLTIKVPNLKEGLTSTQETNVPVTIEAFNAFKMLSSRGMIKHRYTFKVESIKISNGKDETNAELFWEVDVFPNGSGGYHPWCKIDLEINSLMESLPKDQQYKLTVSPAKLPLKLTEVIEGSTQETVDKEKITQLYDEFFLAKISQ